MGRGELKVKRWQWSTCQRDEWKDKDVDDRMTMTRVEDAMRFDESLNPANNSNLEGSSVVVAFWQGGPCPSAKKDVVVDYIYMIKCEDELGGRLR